MARALQQRKRDRDIRVCTAFFGGNMVCLRRCIDEFGWKEEREVSCMDDCAVVWFGNHVNHLSAAGDLQLLTSHRQRAPRFEGLRILCWKDNTAVCIEALRELSIGNIEIEELSIVSNYGSEALQRVTLVRDG